MIGSALGRILEQLRTTNYVSSADVSEISRGLDTIEDYVRERERGLNHDLLFNYLDVEHIDWTDINVETLAATKTMGETDAFLQFLDPGGASRDVTLRPESTRNRPVLYRNAADAAENLVIKNDGGDTILTIEQGQIGLLLSNGTTWYGRILYAALDEDDMASDDDAKVPTQQSVKKYVDDQIATCEPDVTWGDGLQEAAGTASVDLKSGGGLQISSAEIEVVDASTSVAGKVELATAAETTTGTDATRAITPDGFAGSNYGIRGFEILLLDIDTALTVTDGIGSIYFVVPEEINGFNLVKAHAAVDTVSTSGTPTFQINNLDYSGGAQDMLSTAITIDANERNSYTAATPPVINTSYDDVSTGDRLRFDCDVIGTGTKGLVIIMGFQLP